MNQESTTIGREVFGAFSLVITQFQAISAYASVILRLGEFVEAAEKSSAEDLSG